MNDTPATRRASEMREGPSARGIEERTARLPSDVLLWGAVGCMVASAVLQMTERRQQAVFVGQWVPTLLILGLYNKLVKVAGSDRMEPLH